MIGRMSRCRREVFIQAPSEVVWELIADVERHPEWWPRVIEVTCEGLEEGCTYREVTKTPFGTDEMLLRVDELTPGERFTIHCVNTGTFVRIALTEARGGTFLEAEMGMEPWKLGMKVFDAVIGKRYFDNWLGQTVEGLERAASSRAAVG
jgi:uncharacterized protein YndB with AHSA1/START domain